eukprot:CAMPEP_0117735898 /NCGR_PEP_ID=MMETSP0947-20121206/1590_1 /TAXON_ID=44440 /ORGANISM="Chattonella subsalsa, Strain CCMP2191" /LENGTH=552 /DNA_ID=CAMNT_0005551049 /DNA_START=450 /DNA_END=2108 /DNA_ORIENTATION=-
MGWNSWNSYGCDISEMAVKQIANALISSGMTELGYQYVIIDDCWQNSVRSMQLDLMADPDRFPSGMRQLINYLHLKGLKVGLALGAGKETCAGRPGSEGFEKQDVRLLVQQWGVDFIKYDSCNLDAVNLRAVTEKYEIMRDALNATDMPVYYAMGNWGFGSPWHWGKEVANSWQTAGDVNEAWEALVRVADNSVGISRFAGPGGWNDLDVLLVGVTGIPKNSSSFLAFEPSKTPLFGLYESKAQFAVWAIMKSPLFFTNAASDLFSPDILSILGAEEVIAVNQDPLGVAADLVWQEGAFLVYACPLADGSRAVVIWNRHYLPSSRNRRQTSSTGAEWSLERRAYNMTLDFSWIGYTGVTQAVVRDLFLKRDLGFHFVGSYEATVEVHSAVMLKVTPVLPQDLDVVWRPWSYHWTRPGEGGTGGSTLFGGMADLEHTLFSSWWVLGLLGMGWLILGLLCLQGWWRIHTRPPLKYSYLQLANSNRDGSLDECGHSLVPGNPPPLLRSSSENYSSRSGQLTVGRKKSLEEGNARVGRNHELSTIQPKDDHSFVVI